MANEYWNREKLCYADSDEFKYLDKIDDVSDLIYSILSKISKIDMNEYYKIQNNKEKVLIDFSEIKDKLNEVQKLIDEL